MAATTNAKEPSGAEKMFGDFAPALVHFTDEVLFGEAWKRPLRQPGGGRSRGVRWRVGFHKSVTPSEVRLCGWPMMVMRPVRTPGSARRGPCGVVFVPWPGR